VSEKIIIGTTPTYLRSSFHNCVYSAHIKQPCLKLMPHIFYSRRQAGPINGIDINTMLVVCVNAVRLIDNCFHQ